MSKFFNALAVAVLGMALLMGAASATTLSGNVESSWAISALPTDNTNFQLTPGTTETHTGTLTVNTNKGTAWFVKATADAATGHSQGYMSEWDGSAYVASSPKALASPMKISSDDIGYLTPAALTSIQPVAAGDASAYAGETHTVTFSQDVAWGDTVLTTSGHVYQIVVEFSLASS